MEKFLKKHHAQFVQVKVIQPTLQLVLCCQKCKDKFDGNPAVHVPSVVPRPAPDFVVENLKGKDITLKLIDFWATWCVPCVEMVPELQKLNN